MYFVLSIMYKFAEVMHNLLGIKQIVCAQVINTELTRKLK